MNAAQKKKPIGFITAEQTQNSKPVTGNRQQETANRKLPPEGPMLGLMRIRLNPGVYKSIAGSNFVKMRLKSGDGKFAIDVILRDSESRLQLVPLRMPAISLHMEPEEIGNLESRTMVMFEDGAGNNRGYAIATIRQVELMNNGWTNKKHMVS